MQAGTCPPPVLQLQLEVEDDPASAGSLAEMVAVQAGPEFACSTSDPVFRLQA